MRPAAAPIQLPRRARPAEVDFLRRRFADALIRRDDKTASRLLQLLDQALNGPLAARRINADGA